MIHYHLDDAAQAEASFLTALECCHESAHLGERVDAHNGLGVLNCRQGDYMLACTHFRTGLGHLQTLEDWPRTAQCLEGLAEARYGLRDPENAATLLGAAFALRAVVGAPVPRCDQKRYGQVRTAVYSGLNAERFATAWRAGEALSRDEAIALALALLKNDHDAASHL